MESKIEGEKDIIPNKELLTSLANLQADLNQRNVKISELENDILNFHNKIRKLERENRILKNSVECREQDLQHNDNEIQELLKDKICFQNECHELKRILQNTSDKLMYENVINDLKQSLNSRENSIKEKDKIIDCYKLELTEFEEKLIDKQKSFDQEIEKRNIEMEKKNTLIETLNREKETLKVDNENLEHKFRRLEKENKFLKIKADEMTQELADSESQKEDILNKWRALRKELIECKKKYQNEDDLQKYFDEIKDLKQSLKSRENSIKEKDKIIDDYKQKSTEFQEKLKDKNKSLDQEIEKRNLEMEKQNTLIETLNREKETLKIDNEKKQTAILNMREKIKTKNEGTIDPTELKKLQNQIRAKDMEIEQLHSKVENINEAYQTKCDEHDLEKKKTGQLQSEIDNMKKLNFGNSRKDTSAPKPPENPYPAWWSKHMNK